MPNAPAQAAAEGVPLYINLIRISDKLSEASDFCEAVFMAANSIDDKDEATAVFQRLAMVAKSHVREAISMIETIRGPEGEQ